MDSVKTGHRLKKGVFEGDSKSYDRPQAPCMRTKDDEGSWQPEPSNMLPLSRPPSMGRFILDRLLDFGKDLKDQHLIEFGELNGQNARDQDMLQPWKDAIRNASQTLPVDVLDFLDDAVRDRVLTAQRDHQKHELDEIKQFVRSMKEEWSRAVQRPSPTKLSSPQKRSFRRQATVSDPLGSLVKKFADGPGSEEQRASYAYELSEAFAFSVAFKASCLIKARNAGIVPTTGLFADAMTMQSSAIRMLATSRNGDVS